MWRIAEYLPLLVIITIFAQSNGQGKSVKIVNQGGNETAPRLGLLASTLGVDPVPGASYGGSQPVGNLPSQDYLPTGGAPALPPTDYSGGGGGEAQVANLVSPNQCQCVPVEFCPSLGGGQGQQGGNLPPPGGVDPSYGQGQQGGLVPIPGGGGGGSYDGGQQGGNLPVIGGNTGGDSYGGGQQGGNIPVSAGAGTDPGLSSGYGDGGSGGGGGGGGQPNTDGAGLLDLRIVNRPPRPGGVQCLNGQVFCCDVQQPNPDYPGPGGSGGYANCGSRKFIDVPSKQLEYGEAKFGAYPWMAVILGKGNNYVGAGALISPYYVLTAAHKIKSWKQGASMKVRLGEWNAKEDDEPYKNVEVPIESVLIHPGFNLDNLQNDVALVRLAKPVDIKSYPHIEAACLPQKGYQYTGQRCWVAGFGKDAFGNGKHSYIMKEVDLPIVDSDICEQRLRTTRLGNYFKLNRYSFLCAGGEEGKDACTGDGGSPLVCDTGKGWQVVGLVAWGIGCADYGIPGTHKVVMNKYIEWRKTLFYHFNMCSLLFTGVYVNVPNYSEWINEEIYRY
ncbi:unnamed protein product [Orchesella dallaii]|uniref:Peptidase S1 domain-containing protein n=1 Tax=Orchesella dallaii TaxID=48710 RepID=A0ABP1RKV9_9HEXA